MTTAFGGVESLQSPHTLMTVSSVTNLFGDLHLFSHLMLFIFPISNMILQIIMTVSSVVTSFGGLKSLQSPHTLYSSDL